MLGELFFRLLFTFVTTIHTLATFITCLYQIVISIRMHTDACNTLDNECLPIFDEKTNTV